jgi:hypothetical protein
MRSALIVWFEKTNPIFATREVGHDEGDSERKTAWCELVRLRGLTPRNYRPARKPIPQIAPIDADERDQKNLRESA